MPVRETPRRLVETWFPFVEVSRLVAADRRMRDPIYAVHRWFARRPPTLVRALLLGATLPTTTSEETFWTRHATSDRWMSGVTVYDPFLGGGTSLVEAARMGAHVMGRDVDPLAVALSNVELHPQASVTATVEARTLIHHLQTTFGKNYASGDPDWTPLHWFWLRRVECRHCAEPGLLYRDLILARSSGRIGAVVRDADVSAFCPDCLAVHSLSAGRSTVVCCGRRTPLNTGTFTNGKYHCAECRGSSSLEQLQPARAERVMVAVEETHICDRRRIRSADKRDRNLESRAPRPAAQDDPILSRELSTNRRDRRPVSHGFETVDSLFLPRQTRLLSEAMRWIRTRDLPATERQALTLFVTGLLTSNNALCGYARDYGRLAPLFSVRGYSFPILSVELNPLHPSAGRGTLPSGLRRIANMEGTTLHRHVLVDGESVRTQVDLPVVPGSADVVCASADDVAGHDDRLATVCVTDPPYFDYIAYSELSEFFRVWLADSELGGEPLLPDNEDAVASFADRLAACLKVTLTRLETGTPLVFTYHTRHLAGWETIGLAFDEAGLVVTAAWPVLADPGMGAHRGPGNCEWDVVIVCRPDDGRTRRNPPRPEEWITSLRGEGFEINRADEDSFSHALATFAGRFAPPSSKKPPRPTR